MRLHEWLYEGSPRFDTDNAFRFQCSGLSENALIFSGVDVVGDYG